jgi:hypothetical protein
MVCKLLTLVTRNTDQDPCLSKTSGLHQKESLEKHSTLPDISFFKTTGLLAASFVFNGFVGFYQHFSLSVFAPGHVSFHITSPLYICPIPVLQGLCEVCKGQEKTKWYKKIPPIKFPNRITLPLDYIRNWYKSTAFFLSLGGDVSPSV